MATQAVYAEKQAENVRIAPAQTTLPNHAKPIQAVDIVPKCIKQVASHANDTKLKKNY